MDDCVYHQIIGGPSCGVFLRCHGGIHYAPCPKVSEAEQKEYRRRQHQEFQRLFRDVLRLEANDER